MKRTVDGTHLVLPKTKETVLGDSKTYARPQKTVLDGKEKGLGREHPYTLSNVHNMALVLQNQGKNKEAERMFRRAIEETEKALGKEHPNTLESVDCLAYFYHKRKRYDTASELYQRACDGYKRTIGPEHPTTIACCNHYSRMVREIDQSTRSSLMYYTSASLYTNVCVSYYRDLGGILKYSCYEIATISSASSGFHI